MKIFISLALALKPFYRNIFYDINGNAKVQGLNSPLFFIGIFIKLVLGTFLASTYLTDIFIPFMNVAVKQGDAYTHFVSTAVEFPYPGLMEAIFFIPFKLVDLVGLLPEKASMLHLFIFRLVCLVFDFSILLVLFRWLRNHQKKVLIYYWLSPILIYITYIHGQLDVVPMALLVVSLYFLFKEKMLLFAVVLALAIATKTSIALSIPFILIYRLKYSKLNLKSFGIELALFIAVIASINGLFWSDAYQQMVYNNSVQGEVFTPSFKFWQNRIFYIVPAALILLVLRMWSYKWLSKDLLLLFLAFAFGTLTLFITPMQGWYYWVVPFFVYFIIKFNGEAKNAFILLNLAYFVYFAIIPASDYLNLSLFSTENSNLFTIIGLTDFHVNLVFTAMQTVLLGFLYLLYVKGIKKHLGKKLFSQPFLIGLGGDSGSGKTTLSANLLSIFGGRNTTIIRGDDMHRWERGNANWKKVTHLNPKANDLNQDVEDIKHLKDGYSIKRKHYSHADGKFTLPFQIKSNRLVIFEGLHSFYLKSQGSLYDLKVYLDPEESVLMSQKINRDTNERGKEEEEVRKQIEIRKADSEQYVQSQKEMADILVRQLPKENTIELVLPDDVALDALLILLNNNSEISITHEFMENSKQLVQFEGTIASEVLQRIAIDQFGVLSDLGINEAEWLADEQGLVQLILCACILDKVN